VEGVLNVVQVLISVILIFLVLLHSGKDAGLSGAFGVGSGGGSFGGGSLVERNLDRWTIFFGILFVLNTVALLAPRRRPAQACPARAGTWSGRSTATRASSIRC
jgi:preprotein translocase subunit SecG